MGKIKLCCLFELKTPDNSSLYRIIHLSEVLETASIPYSLHVFVNPKLNNVIARLAKLKQTFKALSWEATPLSIGGELLERYEKHRLFAIIPLNPPLHSSSIVNYYHSCHNYDGLVATPFTPKKISFIEKLLQHPKLDSCRFYNRYVLEHHFKHTHSPLPLTDDLGHFILHKAHTPYWIES